MTRPGNVLGLCILLLAACRPDDGSGPVAIPNATLDVTYDAGVRGSARFSQPDQIRIKVLRATDSLAGDTVMPVPIEKRTVLHFPVRFHSQSANEAVDVRVELLERGFVVARGTERVQVNGRDLSPVPVLLDYLRDNFAHGGDHACVLATSGETYCWGRNGIGQLGNGTTTGSSRPVKVNGGLRFVSIDAGADHTCALTEDGQAYCWGSNYMGKLGRGVPPFTPYPDPEPVAGGIRFVQISAGMTHTCGLTADGALYCWGDNRYGALAASVTQTSVPVRAATTFRFDAIEAGFANTCGWSQGKVYCWGAHIGETNVFRNTPELVAIDFRTLAPGTLHSCGADADGKAFCWGGVAGLNYGQLGNGTMSPSTEPVRVAGNLLLRQLTTSRANSYMAGHSCGLDAEGRAYCWGLARFGQLGVAPAQSTNRCNWQTPNIDMPCNPRPVPVAGDLRFITIAAGNESTCAMTEDVRVYCWGYGGFGIIGRGDLDDRAEPTEIGTPTNPTTQDRLTIVVPRVQLAVGDSIVATAVAKGTDGSTLPDGIFDWQSSDDTKVSIEVLPLPQLASQRRVILRAHSPGPVFIEVNGLGLRTWVDLVVNNAK